jgi:hypothetical protein
MHFLPALDLNQYTKQPSPYYILYRGELFLQSQEQRIERMKRIFSTTDCTDDTD